MQTDKLADFVKKTALSLGFDSCGIIKASFLSDDAPRLERWLNKGMHGSMKWMENHFEKRLDPSKLVPGAKSVICLTFNYFPGTSLDKDVKITKFAQGEDYHYVVKDKLRNMVELMTGKIGEFSNRVFVDSAPLMERSLAAKAGLGWIGKHSLLIQKQKGSFFFLAEIVCDLELSYDHPVTNHCGTCTRCIDACPTEAIVDNGVIDARKCISYLTIELKEDIPLQFKNQMKNWVFGCDICQDVCPWNRFSTKTTESRFTPIPELNNNNLKDWQELEEKQFKQIFKKSALKRTKFSGFKRNLNFISDI